MQHPELQFPHEDIGGLIRASAGPELLYADSLAAFALCGLAAKIGELRSVHTATLYQWGARHSFAVFNGHTRGAELADKTRFSGIMDTLGYLAPRTAVVDPGDNPAEALDRIAALSTQAPRFLKPISGSRAKGTMQAEGPEQALDFALREHRPYAVQTVENTDHEWRYVLHRDPRQVRDGAPHGWRLAFRKVRPSVAGDGKTNLDDLVRTNSAMPWYSRLKYRLHQGSDGARIPAPDEHVELAVGGNIGARLPTPTELANLDRFMRTVATDLEKHLGASLATICFDVGARHTDTLGGAYDHQKLRKALVFYEYQVPFGFFSYLPALARAGIRSPAGGVAATAAFINSMFASGKAARRIVLPRL